MAPRDSSTAYLLPGHSRRRWQAAPIPDSPAPTISTSTYSGAVGSAGWPPAPRGSLVTGGVGMAPFSVGVLGRQEPASGRCRGILLQEAIDTLSREST